MISHTIVTEELAREQIQWEDAGANPFRQVFGTGPERIWVGNYEREKMIEELLTPVVQVIWKDAEDDVNPFVESVNRWTFYPEPFTYLNTGVSNEEEMEIRAWLQEFGHDGAFTVWGYWRSESDGVGGDFGTTKDGHLLVLFC